MKQQKHSYEFIKNEFNKRGYELLESCYINNQTKMKYKCPKHPDKNLYIRYGDLMMGHGCPYCAGLGKLSIDELKFKFEERGYTLLTKEYNGVRQKLTYICKKHPDKSLHITYRDFRMGCGCKYCAKNLKLEYDFVKSEFEKRGYILLSSEYKNSRSYLLYKCDKHPEYELQIKYSDFKNGKGCPICKESKGERIISNILISKNVYFEREKSFNDCIYKKKLKFDFYIPSMNLCIEYNGRQHYESSYFGGEKEFENIKIRDSIKKNYCENNNIRLLVISYKDYKNIEKILIGEMDGIK